MPRCAITYGRLPVFIGARMLSRLLALGGVLAAVSSFANETAGNYPEPGKWFLSALASWTTSPDEYDVGDAVTTGLGLGVGLTDTMATELTYLLYSPNRESAGSLQVTGLWALPTERPAFAQGAVAEIPVKLWFEEASVRFVVPAAYAADLGEQMT